MEMLDDLFEAFDSIASRLGVFKVETIGDAYMAVANLDGNQPSHAQVLSGLKLMRQNSPVCSLHF